MHKFRWMVPLLALSGILTYSDREYSQGTLQPGTPMERTLAVGQSHNYTVALKQDQILQLAIEQKGIDVGIRAYWPNGQRLGDFDSPNGSAGTESVSVIAEIPGNYRFEIMPMDQFKNPAPGRYEIRIADLRKATDQELKLGKFQETLKLQGLALLSDMNDAIRELRNPQTSADFQIQMAQLLWPADEKQASRLMQQAVENLKEFIGTLDDANREDNQKIQAAIQLRQQAVSALAPRDPEMALALIQSTRTLSNPYSNQDSAQQTTDLSLSVAGQLAVSNPKLAFQIADNSLRDWSSPRVLDTLNRLREKNPDMAGVLAHDIYAKLSSQRLISSSQDTAYLAGNFLQLLRSPRPAGTANGPPSNWISDSDSAALLQKVVAELVAYSPPDPNTYSQQRNSAQNLVNTLKQMNKDLRYLSPEQAAAVEKKAIELMGESNVANQNIQSAIESGSVDDALNLADHAPEEMRDQLYQQIASKAARSGDLERARQIINQHLQNPMRQQALLDADRQAIYQASSSKRYLDALRFIQTFLPASERPNLLNQFASQIGPGLKKTTASMLLGQAVNLLSSASRAENDASMRVLLTISEAYSRIDPQRGFDLVEPLIDQFNDISSAATTMNGFREKFFDNGELIRTNGNMVNDIGEQISRTLGSLALTNIQRAKSDADRIRLVEVRCRVYLNIAQQAIRPLQ